MSSFEPEPRSLFLIAVVLASVWTAGRAWIALNVARASRSFAETRGRILRSEVVRERVAAGSTAQVQAPSVVFEYEVEGRRYEGDTLSFDPMFLTTFADRAKGTCARYPVGAQVRVFYDPARPEVACLEPSVGITALAALQVVAPLAFGVGAVVLLTSSS